MERADAVLVEAGVDVGAVGEQRLDARRVVAHRGAEERRRQVLVVEHVNLRFETPTYEKALTRVITQPS